MRYRWKDLSLKLLLFINLYPASRGPAIFLDKSGWLKRSVAWQDKTGTILEPQTNRVLKHKKRVSSFEKPAFFILTTRKDFRKTIYFSRNITITICTYIECTDQRTCVYNLSKVKFKFLGDKKGPTKGFYLEVWKIDSVFLYQVCLLNYDNCFYICEGLYLQALHMTA